MSYSITEVKADLEGIIHGTTLNSVQNIEGIFNRASRQLLLDVDPQETKRITQFVNPIYDSVYDYAIPTDLKSNKVIDIRPQVNRHTTDNFQGEYAKSFDILKEYVSQKGFSIRYNTGIKTIRINDSGQNTSIVINQCDTIIGNGTWAVSGDASNLEEDNVNFVSGGGSLKFDLASGGSQGILTNSTIPALDLSDHENQASEFFYSYLQTASAFTSLEFRWGSSASDYWTRTITTTHEANSFANGWNLLRGDWNGATEVGTPDSTSITYLQIRLNYDGTEQTGIRIDNIVSRLGKIYELEYYSKYLFSDATTGAWQEKVTADDNLVNLDTDSYNLFLDKTAFLVIQQVLGQDAGTDLQIFADTYNENLKRYRRMYKSEVSKMKTIYYKLPNTSYRRFNNRIQ